MIPVKERPPSPRPSPPGEGETCATLWVWKLFRVRILPSKCGSEKSKELHELLRDVGSFSLSPGERAGVRANISVNRSRFELSFRRRLKRNFDGKPASFSHFALHPDFSAVRFDDVFDDAQANPDALRFAAQLGAETIEPFKNFLVFMRWNAGAGIFDGKAKARSARILRAGYETSSFVEAGCLGTRRLEACATFQTDCHPRAAR